MIIFRYSILMVLMMGSVGLQAYSPITWIEGVPNNFFAPLCLSNVHAEKQSCSKRKTHIRTNLFASATRLVAHENYQAYGLALQVHMHMDSLLRGLYGEVYAPIIVLHERYYQPNLGNLYERHNGTIASVADVQFLVGVDVLRRKSFSFSSYVFGIAPTGQHSFFHDRLNSRWLTSDNHVAWGLGSDCFVRLCGSPQHHLDWITQTDIIFSASRKATGTLTYNYVTQKTIPIHLNALQKYHINSGLVYKFKHFLSDFGLQFLYHPCQKYSISDPTLINVNKDFGSHFERWDVFFDLGWAGKLFKKPAYATIGTQVAMAGVNTWQTASVTFKCGFDF